MPDAIDLVRAHYNAIGLTDRIKLALAGIAPEDQALTVAQLAPLDQFHTRGMMATAELASAVGLQPATRVLDLGYWHWRAGAVYGGRFRLHGDRRRSQPRIYRRRQLSYEALRTGRSGHV